MRVRPAGCVMAACPPSSFRRSCRGAGPSRARAPAKVARTPAGLAGVVRRTSARAGRRTGGPPGRRAIGGADHRLQLHHHVGADGRFVSIGWSLLALVPASRSSPVSVRPARAHDVLVPTIAFVAASRSSSRLRRERRPDRAPLARTRTYCSWSPEPARSDRHGDVTLPSLGLLQVERGSASPPARSPRRLYSQHLRVGSTPPTSADSSASSPWPIATPPVAGARRRPALHLLRLARSADPAARLFLARTSARCAGTRPLDHGQRRPRGAGGDRRPVDRHRSACELIARALGIGTRRLGSPRRRNRPGS